MFLRISCISLIVLILFTNYGQSLYCYWNTGCPYNYFSSKTSYNAVRGDLRDSIVKLTGCEPISIWGIIKHGRRHPGENFAKSMQDAIVIKNYVVESYDKGHSSLCAQDVENLANWKTDKQLLEQHNKLTQEGYQEMFGIGKRMIEAFPHLLNDMKDGSYTFRPAFGHWIEDSAKAFVQGMGNKQLKIEKFQKDDVMAPYITCGKYQKDVQQNPKIYVEAEKYKRTSDYLAAKDRIQRRSGIEYALTDTNITALYDLCRYTWSGLDKVSPWCALFTKNDLEVLEYIQDLQSYYRNGYGTAENGKFGAIPLQDLLKNFQNAKKGKGKKITAYFTHATMMSMIYIPLGLFKDSRPLTAAKRDHNRKWMSSKITAFGVNLVAVLNKCSKNGPEDYNVVFYMNEEPVRSICEEGVCSWQEFEDKLKPFVNTSIDFCEFQSEPY